MGADIKPDINPKIALGSKLKLVFKFSVFSLKFKDKHQKKKLQL